MRAYKISIARKMNENRGATAIIVAISLFVLIGFLALAVDVGYLYGTRNELQNVADAAALAATRKLGDIYEGMTPQQQQNFLLGSVDLSPIKLFAAEIASKNKAAGISISLNDNDIQVGQWDGTIFSQRMDQSPDAVRVTARRDNLANNSVSTFFAKIFGSNLVAVSATATAALTGAKTIDDRILPIGISKWASINKCDGPITFAPTNNSCYGWNNFKAKNANDSETRKILDDLLNGTNKSGLIPSSINLGDLFSYTGGKLSDNTFEKFDELFQYMKTHDLDGNDSTWTTGVVIYDRNDCSNPNKEMAVVGFATAIITEVKGPPDKTIVAEVICKSFDDGRGSGNIYGIRGVIPGLVK